MTRSLRTRLERLERQSAELEEARRRTESAVALSGLTPRQYAVAQLIADGYSRREIAHALGISASTVKRHRENIALRVPGPGSLSVRVTRYLRQLAEEQQQRAA